MDWLVGKAESGWGLWVHMHGERLKEVGNGIGFSQLEVDFLRRLELGKVRWTV